MWVMDCSRHHSPIESSVRLMLEHLVEIFQGLHLSCCLCVAHKQYLQNSCSCPNISWWYDHRVHYSPLYRKADLSQWDQREFLQNTTNTRTWLKLHSVMRSDVFILRFQQLLPLSEYLWPDDEWTSMNLGRFSSRSLLSCRTASLKR